MFPKLLAPRRANDCPAPLDDVRHRVPVGFHNVVPTVDHALVALVDEEDATAEVEAGSDHGTDSRVHA